MAGALTLAVPVAASAAGPANVTVRVEGAAGTLVPRTALTTTTTPVNKSGNPGEECTGTSAAGALELATAGNWTGTWYSFGSYSVDAIKGEAHTFSDPEYWAFWVNGKPAASGICLVELQEGDAVLFFPEANCYGAGCDSREVLDLRVPASARRGEAFTATVSELSGGYDSAGNPTASSAPSPGATITYPGGAATTDADGRATITLAGDAGPNQLVASKPGKIREREDVCLTSGDDGYCGTTKAGEPAPGPAPAAPACETNGRDGRCGSRDLEAPEGVITSIAEQQRFVRRGPRELEGRVRADVSGLRTVKLRLTRRHKGRCWYFSGSKEQLRRTRCGRAFPFAIGDRAEWSYLLPSALPKGRYVLDAVAIDKSFNREGLARGRNRVVFWVR